MKKTITWLLLVASIIGCIVCLFWVFGSNERIASFIAWCAPLGFVLLSGVAIDILYKLRRS